MPATQLKRALSLTLITFYGIGTILGAGIYALVGSVTIEAGYYTPLAFLLASIVAVFTALSYAELVSRFPHSAGSAFYVRRAFNNAFLSGLIGWLVVLTGIVSSGTMSKGLVPYFQFFLAMPEWAIIAMIVLALGSLALWGIYESVTLIFWMTLLEISGLVMIIFLSSHNIISGIQNWGTAFSDFSIMDTKGIFLGAFIAFYAFIGFEDMVNTAEEVIDVEKNLPKAILIALLATTCLYVLVTLAVVTTLSLQDLKSGLPLTRVIANNPSLQPIFALIAIISIMNGILVQIIMASRLIYGMSKQQNAPAIFSHIHAKTQTPILSTLLVIAVIIILALTLPIETLAKITSSIMLFIFLIINVSLILIKKREKGKPSKEIHVPTIFPYIGVILITTFILLQILYYFI